MFAKAVLLVGLTALVGGAVALQSAPRPTAVQSVPGAWPLGTFQVRGGGPASQSFTVTCPGLAASLSGILWVSPARGKTLGVLVGFSGSYGMTRWIEGFPMDQQWLASVNAAGYEVVDVQWAQPGWEPASPGEDAGPAHAACRPATAIRWIHDNLYADLHVPTPALGACGFCLAGTSGGASQISYALAYYGLASIVNAAFPISGPPHAALAKGCLDTSGYSYRNLPNGQGAVALIDSSFGDFGGKGPCSHRDAGFTARWNQESVDTGGTSYNYPTTRVHFFLGQYDSPVIRKHAADFMSRMQRSGSPLVSQEVVPKMPHDIMSSPAGLASLLKAIRGRASSGGSPAPPATSEPSQLPSSQPPPEIGPTPTFGPQVPLPGSGFERVLSILARPGDHPRIALALLAGLALVLLAASYVIALLIRPRRS